MRNEIFDVVRQCQRCRFKFVTMANGHPCCPECGSEWIITIEEEENGQ